MVSLLLFLSYIFISFILIFSVIFINFRIVESVLLIKMVSIIFLIPIFTDVSLGYISNLLFHIEYSMFLLLFGFMLYEDYKDNLIKYLPRSSIAFSPIKNPQQNEIIFSKERIEGIELRANIELRFCYVKNKYKKFLTSYNFYADKFAENTYSKKDLVKYIYYRNLLYWFNILAYFKLI